LRPPVFEGAFFRRLLRGRFLRRFLRGRVSRPLLRGCLSSPPFLRRGFFFAALLFGAFFAALAWWGLRGLCGTFVAGRRLLCRARSAGLLLRIGSLLHTVSLRSRRLRERFHQWTRTTIRWEPGSVRGMSWSVLLLSSSSSSSSSSSASLKSSSLDPSWLALRPQYRGIFHFFSVLHSEFRAIKHSGILL